MAHSRACPKCLRRSWLLSLAAPYIENTLAGPAAPDLTGLLRLDNEALVEAVAPKVASALLARIEALPESHFEQELRDASCWATCRHDRFYPEVLREDADAPWALIARGDPALLVDFEGSETVTIVGARRATSYGREVARSLGFGLAAAGLTVVSGLAFGAEGCVHRGALEAGRTIAVLASGPDTAYPAAHRALWRQITERGLVVSELPPGAAPWRWCFPARNRIMAALGAMTIVVEAAERSGSLLTAELAGGLGREIGAVPGPITSRQSGGCNQLLLGGAHVVRDSQDVLDVLLGDGRRAHNQAADQPTAPDECD
jgi:DNA processing protein